MIESLLPPVRAGRTAPGLVLLLLAACERGSAPPLPSGPPPERFVSRTEGSGVDFLLDPGRSGAKFLLETNLGGTALVDFDGDGLLDLYLCQGAPLPGHPGYGRDERHDVLYRNLGGFRFERVPDAAGAGDPAYTFSATCVDFDGDLDQDLYLCNFGENRLLENRGNGEFRDVTAATGLAGAADDWSSAAAFVDLDRDGDLDVYVTNYVIFDFQNPGNCGDLTRGPEFRAYCHPDEFLGQDDRLFRNEGLVDGTCRFVDVTDSAGIRGSGGKGLAIVPLDFDDDGDVDLYVANDSVPNFLWRNDGTGHFEEAAAALGVAVNATGRSESCMGSDAADVDGDGDQDLFSANFAMETNTLYVNENGEYFLDDTDLSGLARDSLLWVGFGAKFGDYDLDGDPDLLVANGHVTDNIALYDPHQRFEQPAQLFENTGRGKFSLAGANAGAYFQEGRVGRGLAVGDLDNDGDLDAVFADNCAGPQILENRTVVDGVRGARWIGVQLRGAPLNTAGLGAKVIVEAGDLRQMQEVRTVASYAASNDPRLVFGLGSRETVDRILVRWPTGESQEVARPAAGRYHRIEFPSP